MGAVDQFRELAKQQSELIPELYTAADKLEARKILGSVLLQVIGSIPKQQRVEAERLEESREG